MSNYTDSISMSTNIHHVTKVKITKEYSDEGNHNWYTISFQCKEGHSYEITVHDLPEIHLETGIPVHLFNKE